MKNKLLNLIYISLVSFSSYASEQITIESDQDSTLLSINKISAEINNIKNDIKTDGSHYSLLVSTNYNASAPHDQTWGMDGTEGNFLLGNIGVILLPNTWDIRLSYTGILSDYVDRTGSLTSYLNNYQVYFYEQKDNPLSIDLYFKPLHGSFGKIGFGYLKQQFTYYVGHDQWVDYAAVAPLITYPDALDNSGNVLQIGGGGLDYALVAFNTTITRYYVTYDFHEEKNIPDGFGLKYEYETSDRGVPIAERTFVINPDATIHRIGFGISKTEKELTPGFNLKKLLYSAGFAKFDFFNHVTNQEQTFEDELTRFELEVAYSGKIDHDSIFYTSVGFNEESSNTTPDHIWELNIILGFLFE